MGQLNYFFIFILFFSLSALGADCEQQLTVHKDAYLDHKSFSNDPERDLLITFRADHVYFTWNGYRFDGGYNAGLMPVRLGRLSTKHFTVGSGVVVHIPNLSDAAVAALRNFVSADPARYSLTCSQGVCAAIEEITGIRTKALLQTNLIPALVVRDILAQGLIDSSGQPVACHTHLLGYESLKEYYKEAAQDQLVFALGLSGMTVVSHAAPVVYFLQVCGM